MGEIEMWKAWLLTYADDQVQRRDERGMGIVELVILTALFATAAIGIAAIIINKFTGKANSIPTG